MNRNLLGIKEIGTRLKVSPQRINKLLNTGGSIEKATKGWSITKLGRRLGELKKHIPLQGLNMLFGQKRLLRVIDTSDKYLRRSLIPDITPENLVDENFLPKKKSNTQST